MQQGPHRVPGTVPAPPPRGRVTTQSGQCWAPGSLGVWERLGVPTPVWEVREGLLEEVMPGSSAGPLDTQLDP